MRDVVFWYLLVSSALLSLLTLVVVVQAVGRGARRLVPHARRLPATAGVLTGTGPARLT